MKLHPKFLSKDGVKQFAVLPYDEFVALQERLADAEDSFDLREAKRTEGDAPTVSLGDLKGELGRGDG